MTATSPPATAASGPTWEDLRTRAQPWLEPVSDAQPTGTSAKFDPAYEMVSKEIAKLESPLGAPVDWILVVEKGTEFLKTKSKDLLIAGYVARGLHATKGLAGLTTGLALLDGMMEVYWPGLFPEVARLKARANALAWFVDNVTRGFSPAAPAASDRPELEAVLFLVKHLSDGARQNFGNATPGFGLLFDVLERARIALPAEAPPPPPALAAPPPLAQGTPPAAPTQPANDAPAAVAAPPPSTSVAVPVALPTPGPSGDVSEYLRSVGAALLGLAGPLRQAQSADPTSYRLLRVGLYLGVGAAPPVSAGRTKIPPLQAPLRSKLELLAANGKWLALLDEAESSLEAARYCLDLHRYSAQALTGLGDSHRDASRAVVAEVSSLLKRLPELPGLSASDGSPLASAETRNWIDTVVVGAPAGEGGGDGGGSASAGVDLSEVRKLAITGKLPEALTLAQTRIAAAPSGLARFSARLDLADLVAGSGQPLIARAMYEDLDREIATRGLESWQPALVVRCLEGLLKLLRIAAKAAPTIPGQPKSGVEAAAAGVIYDRLCRLDPAVALRLGGS